MRTASTMQQNNNNNTKIKCDYRVKTEETAASTVYTSLRQELLLLYIDNNILRISRNHQKTTNVYYPDSNRMRIEQIFEPNERHFETERLKT